MKQVQISFQGTHLDYRTASLLAMAFAHDGQGLRDPMVVAWHDKSAARMSPDIAGADINTRWHDYGASHAGQLEVAVNGEYDFVFADAGEFPSYGPSPYANLSDRDGHEYICQISALRDRHVPEAGACVEVDEYTSKLT